MILENFHMKFSQVNSLEAEILIFEKSFYTIINRVSIGDLMV